jgi:DNA-binding transcriptional MerR regulator
MLEPATTTPMRIGELAALVAIDAPTIRFYETEGVLPEAARSESGYRTYSEVDVDRLRFIRQARVLGLSLAEIREITVARDTGSPPCTYVRRLLGRRIEDTKQQVRDLRVLLTELERLEQLSQALPADPVDDEPCICHAIESSELADTTE